MNIERPYFIGIGGIGMSALARYFNEAGKKVSGYDKTPTALTDQLIAEGIEIHFEENLDLIPKDADLVVYTPAVPAEHKELVFYQKNGYPVKKRAEVLGDISREKFTVAVAGSHGKTTVSSMIAHILRASGVDCTAFLGGISTNFNSNYVGGKCNVVVVEADEFDRSFLRLDPNIAVITAIDTDHLDIYKNHDAIKKTFLEFTGKIKPGGTLVANFSTAIDGEETSLKENEVAVITYSIENGNADFFVENVEQPIAKANGFELPFHLNYPGIHNVENALAAIAVARELGIDKEKIAAALLSFSGIKRRFEYVIKNDKLIFIDDYAHHPREIEMLLKSVKSIYPTKKITAVFQPHLFTRTRDLADGFAESLSLADEVILLDIYPARELPVEGVSSEIILEKVKVRKQLCSKEHLVEAVKKLSPEVLLTIGAGDIDKLVLQLKSTFVENE